MIGRITIIANIVRYIYPENAGVSPFHLPTSCTPEGVSEVLMKVALILQSQVFRISFFYLGFLSQITFTNHRTAGELGGHFFNSSLPIRSASQTLRYSPGDYYYYYYYYKEFFYRISISLYYILLLINVLLKKKKKKLR